MRDHCKTRVWALRPKKIDGIMYSDTFFSSIMSVRGYIYFQMFAYKNSKFEKIELMRREANVLKNMKMSSGLLVHHTRL